MSNTRVIVWDPKGEYWEGALVQPSQEAHLAARGVALLPLDSELLARGGNSGFVKRAWGAGYPLDAGMPRLHCPVTLMLFQEATHVVHWKARLMSDPTFDARALDSTFRPGGSLRFVGDGSREHTHHTTASNISAPIDLRELGPKDERNGWTIGGKVAVRPHLSGHFGFALYGQGEGLRVAWLAVSATEK